MIARYSRAEMSRIWSIEARFEYMLRVEKAVADAQGEMGIIPKTAAANILKKAKYEVAAILELEKTLKHDVIAFVKNVASHVGDDGKYVHYGMTSSDVLDTASSLQFRDACQLIEKELEVLLRTLKGKAISHAETLCAGRTHGMHAEPTTFGYKLMSHGLELSRALKRFRLARETMLVGKLSGAVGTYSTQSPEVERRVCIKLDLRPESVATQVIPRDRHADVLHALTMIGCALERLAIELRHLQRTEVGEVTEGFGKGQRGSSAMPHKKNPISAENVTGLARLLRSYMQSAYENIALWHERDISHSSVERVIWPDAFLICDYALSRMNELIDGLVVDGERMLKNMWLSQGQIFSSHLLLKLVDRGLSRDDAYKLVQELSHQLKPNEILRDLLLSDSRSKKLLNPEDVDAIFSGASHREAVQTAFDRAMKEWS